MDLGLDSAIVIDAGVLACKIAANARASNTLLTGLMGALPWAPKLGKLWDRIRRISGAGDTEKTQMLTVKSPMGFLRGRS